VIPILNPMNDWVNVVEMGWTRKGRDSRIGSEIARMMKLKQYTRTNNAKWLQCETVN